MVDIHTHILPFVDDGPKSVEKSIALLEDSIKQGMTTIVLTPHYMKYRGYLSTARDNRSVFEELISVVSVKGLNIHLILGQEIYYTSDTIQNIRDQMVIPFGNTKLMLVEFSTSEEDDIAEAIHNIKSLGFIPIIAHVERYDYLSVSDISMLKRMGALIQVNAGSVIGEYGTKAKALIHKLLKEDLVDFVASDIHPFRKNYMKDAYAYVLKKYGQAMSQKLFYNPIIQN